MKKILRLMIFCLLLAALGLSCSEEVKPIPYNYTQIFTGTKSKTWQVQFLETTVNDTIVDTFSSPCFTDDSYVFHASGDHLYEVKFGTTACSNDPSSNISDAWSFNNATATMTIIVPFLLPDTSLPFIVRQASSTKLILEIFLDEAATESYRIHFTKTSEE